MMKTFHSTRKRKSFFGRNLLLVLIVFLLIEILWSPIRGIFLTTTTPLVQKIAITTVETKSLLERIFSSKNDLQKQIKDLQEEVYALQFIDQQADLIRKENQSLRSLLNFQENNELEDGELAQVIQRPTATKSDQMIALYQGERSDLLGKMVFFGPYRLGIVSQVVSDFVTIDLYSREDMVKGLLGEESVDLRSQGSMLFTGQIPKSIEVEIGDVITLESFPDRPFITITDIETNEVDPFQTFFAKIPVAFSDISYVTLQ